MAIVSPRYFTRPECRRELVAFLSQSRSLGLQEYLLPIVFVSVPDLTEDSPDELKATIARTQFVDWSSLRLLDQSAREYRQAVHNVVARLTDIESRLTDMQLHSELAIPCERAQVTPVLDELISQIEELLPAWHEAVLSSQTRRAQIAATHDAYYEQLKRLKAQRAPQAARLSALVRLGAELEPLTTSYVEMARTYSRRCIELDPFMTGVARHMASYPEDVEMVIPILLAIDDAHQNIIAQLKRMLDQEKMGWQEDQFYRENARFSRTYQNILAKSTEVRKLITEGNEIVERWRESITSASSRADVSVSDSSAGVRETSPEPE